MELLIGSRQPQFHIRPIYEVLQTHLEPLREHMEWGPYVEYNITGQLQPAPRMPWPPVAENNATGIEFYDRLTSEV